jgi:hypothetical protein
MYHIAEVIENEGAPSRVAEVSFHPSGAYFAVTYGTINEVRVHDSRTRKLLQVLRNPEAQLDGPHGVLFTEKYLVVANAHNQERPSTINVYRNDRSANGPIQVFQTPFDHLREAHSLAMRDGRLVATYCGHTVSTGAIVSYGFNEETGEITGAVDKTESWFSEYGDPKGICFNGEGTKILVSFESRRELSIYDRLIILPFRVANSLKERGAVQTVRIGIDKITRKVTGKHSIAERKDIEKNSPTKRKSNPTNGIAIFPISAEGKIGRSPERVILREERCRLENIDIVDDSCLITDTVNHAVLLYDLVQDPELENPVQTIDLGKALPHGAKFSPDGRLLIVTSFGVKVVNKEILFGHWNSGREDKVFVFERAY